MAAQPPSFEIVVDRDLPFDGADVIIVPVDRTGAPDPGLPRPLYDYLLRLQPIEGRSLETGYHVAKFGNAATLLLVAAERGTDAPALSGRNLANALFSVMGELGGATVWLPVDAPDPSDRDRISAGWNAVLDGLYGSGIAEKSGLARALVSLPADVDDVTIETIYRQGPGPTKRPRTRGESRSASDTSKASPKRSRSRRQTSDQGPAAEAPTPPPQPNETTPFHADHPARVDALGRRAVAEAVATIVRDVRRAVPVAAGPNADRTFMVHIHGRWGSGKSSILNFLGEILRSGRDGSGWVVVDYNAWRNQGRGPAWWTLLNQVYTQALEQIGTSDPAAARALRTADRIWRIRSGWLPYALVVIAAAVLVVVWASTFGLPFDKALGIIGTVLTITVGAFAFGRTYRIGSAHVASTLQELERDPLKPLMRRYEQVIDEIGRPVAVFVDDLDRCDAAFVVELLQSIQTLYRHAPVLYVVAADRDWVCSSYEQVYREFKSSIGEPGRPLGHLFLEKIFQLSITVPNLPPRVRREYWERLVKGDAAPVPDTIEEIRTSEAAALAGLDSEAAIRAHVESIDEPTRRQIAGAVAFGRLQESALVAEREHLLAPYAPLVEPNPRAMKRLVNAYGFKRGFELMAERLSEPDKLVRWTIVELRWPELAAWLAQHPDAVPLDGAEPPPRLPGALVPLYASREVRDVLQGLSEMHVRRLVVGHEDGATAEAAEPAAA